jgi:hypothetical protein
VPILIALTLNLWSSWIVERDVTRHSGPETHAIFAIAAWRGSAMAQWSPVPQALYLLE